MEAPKEIYVREFTEGLNQLWDKELREGTSALAQHKYIRADLIESRPKVSDNSLEEEITRYLREDHDRDTTVRDVARHFADWGAEHLKK